MTTLYFHVAHIERLNADAVSKLNALMGLVKREDALKLPTLIHNLVWNDTQIDTALSEIVTDQDATPEKIRAVSEKIVDMSHKRFRYGRYEDMVQQVQKLISSSHQLAAAA